MQLHGQFTKLIEGMACSLEQLTNLFDNTMKSGHDNTNICSARTVYAIQDVADSKLIVGRLTQ